MSAMTFPASRSAIGIIIAFLASCSLALFAEDAPKPVEAPKPAEQAPPPAPAPAPTPAPAPKPAEEQKPAETPKPVEPPQTPAPKPAEAAPAPAPKPAEPPKPPQPPAPGSVMLLWPGGAPGALGTEAKDKPQITLYLAQGEHKTDCAVVVCPGGGYGGLAMDHEGKQIADWLNSFGVAAIVLEYRHRGKGYGQPAPLQDALRALRLARANAAAWGISPQKIGIMGFSAGGHLASSVGTKFTEGNPEADDPVEKLSSRPDFLILCYPVIAFGEPYNHMGSMKNLLGDDPPQELIEQYATHKLVNDKTPPTFIFQTDEDQAVPAENALAFYQGLRRHKIPAEMHIYRVGPHGVGLGKQIIGTQTWAELCRLWLINMKFL